MARIQRTRADWAVLLSKQAASGQCVKEWCIKNEINVNSMYNQIGKNRKEQAKNENKQTTGIKDPEGTKAKRNNTKPVTVEWKEIKIFPEQHREAVQRDSVYIEIGGIRLTADTGYPVTNLATLCKELIKS